MRFTALVALIPFLVLSAMAQTGKPRGDLIVPEGAALELLFTRSAPIAGGLTEGPAVAPDGAILKS